MNPLRLVYEAAADRIHAAGDAQARAYGLIVERLPWGGRRIYDPRVPVWFDQRRARALRDGLDAADRAVLAAAGTNLARLPTYSDARTRAVVLEAFLPAAEQDAAAYLRRARAARHTGRPTPTAGAPTVRRPAA